MEPVVCGTDRMHVILATVGTDGDVFPHVGLGATLHARGIEFRALVTVAEVGRMLADPDLWHPFRRSERNNSFVERPRRRSENLRGEPLGAGHSTRPLITCVFRSPAVPP